MQAIISRLVVYPVKSLQGIEVKEAICLETGLQFDREWVIVDNKNRFVSQRNLPAMATIQVSLTSDHLVLSHPDHGECAVALANAEVDSEELTIWQDQSLARDEGHAISEWLTQVLGEYQGNSLRLLRFDPRRKRLVREKYTQLTDAELMFADACPYLVVNSRSLTALNQVLLDGNHLPVAIDRFRGNIELVGIDPWQEYQVKTLRINQVVLRAEAPCHRCPMPGIDQTTGKIPEPGEPFKTLTAMPIPEELKGAYFGMHATFIKQNHRNENKIKTGDRMEITC